MTPDQAHFLMSEVYLPQIRNEHQTTRRVLGAVPADRLDYTPDPVSMTSWKLATHIAASEIFFMSGAANGEFRRENAAIPDSVKTPAALVQWYDEQLEQCAAKLAAMDASGLVKNVPFAIFNFPAINYIGLMLSHSAHHRGQLSAYLRPMGAKVPRIYGGSADEPIEATAGQ